MDALHSAIIDFTEAAYDNFELRFTYQVTHFPPNDNPVRLPEKEETDEAVVLPAYTHLKAGQTTPAHWLET